MADSEIIYKCDKILNMLGEEPQELEIGLKGDILEHYKRLLELESECMKDVKRNIRRACENEQI